MTLICIGCETSGHKAERQHQEREVRVSHDIASLSSHYNAVTDWQQALTGKTLSIDVEPIFLRVDHRPVLFYATLEDVKQQSDVRALYFRTVPTEREPTLRLILDCNKCDLQKLSASSQSIGDFAVVAEPVAVSKLLDGSEDSPDFVLNGKYIDAQFVDDYAFDKALARNRSKASH